MQTIHVYPDNRLEFNGKTYRCALGPNGMIAAADHLEGDKCTPAGNYPIREIWFRADRITLPPVNFPVHEITRADGWCDAPEHPEYNRHVKLPFDASHENLWHDNHGYDVIVVIGHNDAPVVPYLGSAIFFHIAQPEYTPTAGCVAISQPDMLAILPQLAAGARMHIHAAA
jgi:L,D-peptidoglycan transpeptidase YkuD (ErfK/YbiS/YcfS/YnhG family)